MSRRVFARVRNLACLAFVLPLAGISQPGPTVIQVANGDVAGLISAIQALNQSGGGTIVLAASGQYTVTQASDYWYGPDAFPAITSNILIMGSGATISRATSAPKFRFFYVAGGWEANAPQGTLTLTDLTLTNGLAEGGNGGPGIGGGGGGAGLGGAIYNQGQLNLARMKFVNNAAQGGNAGGCCGAAGGGGGGGLGGNGGSAANGYGAGGGGFKNDGQNSSYYQAISPSYGGNFLGSEGGGGGPVCSGGTSIYGGNGGGSGQFANGGGGGGGYTVGENGGTSPYNAGPGGGGAVGAGNGGNGAPYWNNECSGSGGAFGGGGGGAGMAGGGGGGVGGGGGGGDGQGGAGGFGSGGGGSGSLGGGGGQGGFAGGGGNGGAGGLGSGGGSGAGMGGAIFNQWGQVNVGNAVFSQNAANGGTSAQGLGGGIFNLDGQVQLWNVGSSPFGTASTAADLYNLSDNAGNYQAGQTPNSNVWLVDVPAVGYDIANTQNNGSATVNAFAQSVEFTLSGTALGNGPSGYLNGLAFGHQPLNSTTSQTVTLTNSSQVTGANISIQLIGSGFSLGHPPCATLGAGIQCPLTVTFSPTSEGPAAAEVLIYDGAPDSPQVVYLTGSGGYPAASLSPSSLTMSTTGGTPVNGQITLTNTDSGNPLTVSSVQMTSGVPVFSQANTCAGAAVAPGGDCTITVQYAPGTSVNDLGSITIVDDAPNSPQAVSLTGTNLLSQTIIFPALTSPVTVGGQVALNATATSGEAVTYQVLSGTATLSGNTVTFTTTGQVTIEALAGQTGNYAAATPVSQTVTVTPAPIAYVAPATALQVTSAVQSATVNLGAGGTVGSISVLTQGATGKDFNVASGGTCAPGTAYAAGQACTVSYTFKPLAPGQRSGAIVLKDGSGNVLGTSYLSGTGTGGLGVFTAGTQSVSVSSVDVPRGLSLDGYGNLYALETRGATGIDEFPAGSSTRVQLASLAVATGATAVDGAGNLWIATYEGSLYELAGAAGPLVQVAGIPSSDNNLEIDGAGNLYFSDYNTGALYEFTSQTHQLTTLVQGGAGRRFVGMAIDAAGNLYAADYNNSVLYELFAGTGNLVPLVSGGYLAAPHGVAVDPAGNIYVTNENGSAVIRYAAGSYAPTLLPEAGQRGIVLDGSGNMYTVTSDSTIAGYTRTQGTAASFANTTVGSTSSLQQGVSFENDGNANLVITTYSVPAPFALGGALNTCAAGSMASGASCVIGATYTPLTASTVSGTATITDNSLGVAGTAQTLSLAGTGLQQTPTVMAQGASMNFSSSPTLLTAVVSYAASTVPSGAVTFTVDGGTAVTGICSGGSLALSCTASYPTGTLSAGAHTISASIAADANFTTATGTAVLTVIPLYPLSVTAAGSGAGSVNSSDSGISCSDGNGTTAGTCTASYPSGMQVTLTAKTAGSSVFQGWGGACASSGTNAACTVTMSAALSVTASFVQPSFGNVNVCPAGQAVPAPCSATVPVTFTMSAGTTLGVTQVVTQGATGLDFSLGSGSTCDGAVAAGTSCVVNVTFAPVAPGLRQGAVRLFDTGGNLVATTEVYGVGQAPAIAFGPGAQGVVNLGSYSLYQPKGATVDAAGDLFIGDVGNRRVVKVAANGAVTTVGSGLQYPQGLAVDGAGDLFVADNNLNQVVEIPAGCASSACQRVVDSNYRSQLGVAVDGTGNVYFGDFLDGEVVKVAASDGSETVVYGPSAGSNPVGLAVDAAGNLFVADFGVKKIIKVPAGCTNTACYSTVGTGWVAPEAVAVDAAGDVFVADEAPRIVEVPAGCNSGACQITLSGVLAYGVAVDAKGDVVIPDLNNNRVVVLDRSQPQALNFALANVGAASADSPQTISIQNIGNQPLTGSIHLSLGGNFVESASCANAFPLAAGAVCSESVSFMPQGTGYLTGAVTFSDNTGNLSQLVSLQTVNLSGEGGINGQAVAIAVPNVVGLTQAAATAALSGAGLATGSVSTAASSIVPTGSVIASNPAADTQVSIGSAVRLLISSGQPTPPMPNPLSFQNNYFVTGDYASAGVTLRGTGVGGMATGTITIADSTTNPGVSQGVPEGADILAAYLYWETLESGPSASGGSGRFRGYAITGQQIGNDVPYTDGAFSGALRVYRADVNAYFPAGANGIRLASGAHTVSLPDGGGAALPMTEGASLVVIYRVMSQNMALKSVVIYDGSAQLATPGQQVVQGFYDATGAGESTTLFARAGSWNNNSSTVTLPVHASQYSAPLDAGSAYAAVILSTPVNNSDNDGILDAWKNGPAAGDFHQGEPGYYDVKSSAWVGLPGAKHGQKDLFVQLDYMCGSVLSDGSCDPAQENLFPSPDAQGNDPLAMVKGAFATSGVQLHLDVENAVPEDVCTDNLTTSPPQLCQFPNQRGVISWKNSLEFSKLWPKNLAACATGGDCSPRFAYGRKDSYHYLLMGHSLAIPAWNARFGTLASIQVLNGVTTIVTADRGTGIHACPSRVTISGVLGNPGLNGVYNTTGCADRKTITVATPGVANWSYPNAGVAEPLIGLTSGTVTSTSGYSDLGGADSAVTLGLWLTAANQDMSKRANVVAGTIFHEIGHTLGLSHGGIYYDTPGSYVPTFEANCKPNYQSVMNYLFQLDLVGAGQALAFSNQTLSTLSESTAGSVRQLTDTMGNAATFPTSAWYVPYTQGSTASPATRHCDGTALNSDAAYRVQASISPVAPAWANGQDINFDGQLNARMRGYNDVSNMDLRQVGATGGQMASLASVLNFGSSATPLNISAGGSVAVGSGGTITLGSGGNVTLGSGGNVTLGSGGTITLGSGGNVTLGSGGNVTLGSGGTITMGSGGNVTLGSGGNVTLGSGGTITLGSGGNVTLGSGGNVTLGSGGTITLGSGGVVTIPSSGGSYTIDSSGGTITLGSGGNVTLGSGGNVTLGSGGTITLGSGGNVTLGSGGNVTLGSGGTITLGSGGNVTLGSGGNVTLGSGGTITMGSGGTITMGSGGNVTLGSGGTVTLGSGGDLSVGSGGNVTLGSGGTATLGAGGTVTLGSGGNVTLGSGGNVTLGSGGTITMGSGGNVTLGSGGNVTLGSGGTITLGSGGTITLGSGGNVTLGSGGVITLGSGGVVTVPPGGSYNIGASGGTITLGSGGNVTLGSGGNVTLGSGGTITLGSGGTVTLGSGGNVTLGSGGTITMGSGGTITLGSGGNVTLGSGGNVTLGSGGNVTLGSGGNVTLGSGGNVTLGSGGAETDELTYEVANSVVRPPSSPTETPSPVGVRINWTAPAFGVVQTYIIYRSSDGATPIEIGSVSGVNGQPPATTFLDTNPDLTSKTVLYTISTTLLPVALDPSAGQSPPSVPAVLKNDQTVVLGALPSSVTVTDAPPPVTATAMSGGVPNGLPVSFVATGSCGIASQSSTPDSNGVSSATVALKGTGTCTIAASQPGTDPSQTKAQTYYNPANAVSGTFTILPHGATTQSQTITFAPVQSVQYGSTFALSATSSSGQAVTFSASGPCTASGATTGVGLCSLTASAAATSTYSAASVTQSFTIYPAVLTVAANKLSVAYGQAIPQLTYTVSGFVKGDPASVVSGTPALTTTAAQGSAVGSYPITVTTGSLAAANYSFLFASGTVTITKATATVTLGNLNQTYTASPLKATASTTSTVQNIAITYNGATALPVNAGSYAVAATVNDPNYQGTASGTLLINRAPQSITFAAPPAGGTLGNFGPITLKATASTGLPVSLSVTGPATLSGNVLAVTDAGTIVVTANQLGNANYLPAPAVSYSIVIQYDTAITITLQHQDLTYPGGANLSVCVAGTAHTRQAGTILLLDNGAVIQQQAPDGSGCEHFNIQGLNAGKHVLSANYLGNGTVPPGDSAPVVLTIAPAPVELDLDCNPGTIQPGQDEHCRLSVHAAGIGPGANTRLTGAVSVTVDGVPVAVTLNPGGSAMIVLTKPATGSHAVVATFAGQQNYSSATRSQTFTVRAGGRTDHD